MKIDSSSTSFYYLIAILIIAAVLRLSYITQPFTDVFSWRQSSTAMMADNFYRTNWNILYPEVNWTGPGPNYQGREFQTVSYIAALLYTIMGQHDWVARSVAVVFGLWGIFALYQLVYRVWDKKHALTSAAVMAVAPSNVFIERSFLPDPAMVALVTTSLWMLVVHFQTGRQRYLLLAIFFGVWGGLTKIPGLIVGLPTAYAMVAILGRQKKLSLTRIVTLGIAALITLGPITAYYLWARYLALAYPPHHFAGDGNWLWDQGLQKWLSQNYFLTTLWWWFKFLWTIPIIGLVALGLLSPPPGSEAGPTSLAASQHGKAPWLFHWWFLAGIIYYVIGSQELVNNPWNFHILNPAAAVLAGRAVILVFLFMTTNAWHPLWKKMAITKKPKLVLVFSAVILFCIGILGQHILQPMYHPPLSDQSYSLGLALREASQPGDLVITIPKSLGNPNAIYYSQRRGWVFPPAGSGLARTKLPQDDDKFIQLFEELRASGADWIGIADVQTGEIWTEHPKFVEHIKLSTEFYSKTEEYLIYRILSPEEVPLQHYSVIGEIKDEN